MSAILDKYESIKAKAIAAEGYLKVHTNWIIGTILVFLIGVFVGHRWF